MRICRNLLADFFALGGVVLFLLALPLTAQAVPATGPYLAFDIGYNVPGSGENRSTMLNGVSLRLWQKNYDNILYTASAGYAFSTGWRLEAEGNYTRSSFSLRGIQGKKQGFLQQYGLMLNGYYDFDVGLSWFYPYFGAGLGYQWLSQIQQGDKSLNSPGIVAYQFIVGATLPLPPVVGLSLIVGYHFMNMIGPGIKFSYPVSGVIRQTVLEPMSSQAIVIGLKYNFNAIVGPSVTPPLLPYASFN